MPIDLLGSMTGNCADLGKAEKAEVSVFLPNELPQLQEHSMKLGEPLQPWITPGIHPQTHHPKLHSVQVLGLWEGRANASSREREKVFGGGEGKVEKEVFLLRRKFLFPLAGLKAKAQI